MVNLHLFPEIREGEKIIAAGVERESNEGLDMKKKLKVVSVGHGLRCESAGQEKKRLSEVDS